MLAASQAYSVDVFAIQPGLNAPVGTMLGNQFLGDGGNPFGTATAVLGPVGNDFVVNQPVDITSLAVFDDGQDGIAAATTLTVELWSRETYTTQSFADDTGIAILASDTFTSGSPGTLNGKFRTKTLASPLTLQPGAYTISAWGFNKPTDLLWNFGRDPGSAFLAATNYGPPVRNETGGTIQFVGTSRFRSSPSTIMGGFPITQDVTAPPAGLDVGFQSGPVRYLAGNFIYTLPASEALLSVRVDRATGAMTLTNGTASPVTIVGYSITSAFGSLNSNNWLSIAANYDDNNDGTVDPDDNWTRLTTSGARGDLTEFELEGGNGATLAASQSVNLGAAPWIASHVEDLSFQYVLTNGTQVQGDIQYSGNGGSPFKRGDLDFDGTPFEISDFQVMLPNLISNHPTLSLAEAYQLGDLNADKSVDQKDFRLFKVDYIAGGGSVAALENALLGVPEPASLAIGILGGLGVSIVVRRKRGRCVAATFLATVVVLGVGAGDSSAQIIALQSQAPLAGNQSLTNAVGMDFIVNEFPISVSSLGFFDADQNGLSTATIRVDLWSRNDQGTPTVPAGDTGIASLANISFTSADVGTLEGGSRFKAITPIELSPGAYTIVAQGFTAEDPVHNTARVTFPVIPPPTINDSGGLIQFVGLARFSAANPPPGTFPGTVDGGPANRYHAGTFKYLPAFDPLTLQVNRTTGTVTLLNTTAGDSFNVDFYELHSNGGSLNPTGWNSLEDQNESEWFETGNQDSTSLAEANLMSTLFGPGASRWLGNAYNTSVDSQDVSLTYATTGGTSIAANVQYVVGLSGDFNDDDKVDSADYVRWRKNETANNPLPNDDGLTTQADRYSLWQRHFGEIVMPGSGGGNGAVPEPSSGVLLLSSAMLLVVLRCRASFRRCAVAVCLLAGWLVASAAPIYAYTNEREYRLGDDALEGAVAGEVIGSGAGNPTPGATLDSQGPTGAFLDIPVIGNPTYVNVADRPGATAGALGGSFDGVDDRLSAISVTSFSEFWDSTVLFPNRDYPLNYELLTSHGMQLWLKPNALAAGTRQDVILDTNRHGVFISATGKWSQIFATAQLVPANSVQIESVSNVDVAFDEWSHVMQLSGITDLIEGRSRLNGALLVNGVAVSTIGASYTNLTATPEFRKLAIGSNLAGDGNFYRGLIDDARVFLWGNNTGQITPVGAMPPFTVFPTGQNYGRLHLGEDNDWIARQLSILGVTDDADVNLDGFVNQADVTAFSPNWLMVQTLNGVQIGDWNSRQDGDLNYDGAINLADAIILHQGLLAAGAGGLNFASLGQTVPEPSSLSLFLLATLAFTCRGSRRDYAHTKNKLRISSRLGGG
ncbi:MAG: hypothetical protein L0228_19995 [Planctomycetes bacterium]|nr:hypothetical protein [Planctomycetota bacterium]